MTGKKKIPKTHVFVALGANLPFAGHSPEETVLQAIRALGEAGLVLSQVSEFYRTPAFPADSGPDYVNAAAVAEVPGDTVDAGEILALLHRIEAQFGRKRQLRWAGRTLDIDLLAVGDSVLPDAATQDRWRDLAPARQAVEAPDRLILPHPRLQDRAFVLVPLAEVAPDWRHPRTGLTVAEMLDALPRSARDEVKRL
jgi:2-amino-4-hydroxy-6-hydroxymethyldihydropteridine diphosphokinase